MFNLVQIQERLKDMPMQALMAYANGQSQEVPPFLALGELNRRKRMQANAQAEQAKQMEGAPTVKEQIEQATGLMALQGARQRQAASQQQGLQALSPKAPAPNTTTSEPAQLASGGAINDVIGRDFQAGGGVGQMNPQMLKKLMMLKKMKQMQQARGGLGGLAGKDYAGGGIVAFAEGSKSPIGKSPAEETEEDRRRKASMMAVRPGDLSMYDELQGLDTSRAARGATEEATPEPKEKSGAVDQSQQIIKEGLGALRKVLRQSPESMFPTPEGFDEQRQFDKLKQRKGLYGVSDQYLTDRENVLKQRDEELAKRRAQAQDPMQELRDYLGAIAASKRGGNWATQASEGITTAENTRRGREDALRKEEQANQDLRFAVAEKRQAIANGDMAAAARAEEEIKKAQMDVAKARAGLMQTQATAGAKMVDTGVSGLSGGRDTDWQRQWAQYSKEAAARGEVPSLSGFANVMGKSSAFSIEDALKIVSTNSPGLEKDELVRNSMALFREINPEGYAIYMQRKSQNPGATGSGVTVTTPNGKTYSFPTQEAADAFKKKAGIQ